MPSKPRTPQRWQCPVCGAGVTLYAEPPEPPIHPCHKRSGKVYRLEKETP